MFTFLHLFHWKHYQRRTALGLGIVNFNRRCCCVMKNHNLEHNYYYSALHWDVISNAITVEQWYTTSTFHVVNSRSNNQLCHDKYKQIQLTATTNPTQCQISDDMSHTCTHINNAIDNSTCTTPVTQFVPNPQNVQQPIARNVWPNQTQWQMPSLMYANMTIMCISAQWSQCPRMESCRHATRRPWRVMLRRFFLETHNQQGPTQQF